MNLTVFERLRDKGDLNSLENSIESRHLKMKNMEKGDFEQHLECAAPKLVKISNNWVFLLFVSLIKITKHE